MSDIKNHTMNMTEGNIFKQIVCFTIPIMLSGVLQIMYSAMDTIIVGKFSGDEALAAVGSTSPAINMITNIFFGITAAMNIFISQKYGENDKEGLSRVVHSSAAIGLIFGIVTAVVGITSARKLLELMASPKDVMHLSTLYMRIYFLGIPSAMMFSFGSAVLFAVGDSKRPTMYSLASGIINVLLNLFFVIVLKLSVAGVAIATVLSQTLSAFLVLRCLVKNGGFVTLNLRKIKPDRRDAKKLIPLGVAAGVQTTLISMANVVVQTSVNGCGSMAMAASSVANSIEGIVYIALYAFFQTAITFTGQNYGCGNFKRVKKGFVINLFTALGFGIVYSQFMLCISPWLLKLYTDSDLVLALAKDRMHIVCATYYLCVISEVANGALRGLGVINKVVVATIVCDLGVRIVMTLMGGPFQTAKDLEFLFFSFPVSWILAGTALTGMFIYEIHKREKGRKGDLL